MFCGSVGGLHIKMVIMAKEKIKIPYKWTRGFSEAEYIVRMDGINYYMPKKDLKILIARRTDCEFYLVDTYKRLENANQ